MQIFVIGHKSPDLDTVASAITYVELLKKSKKYGDKKVIAVRAGEENIETDYVLKEFDIKLPKHINEYNIDPRDKFILVDHNEKAQRYEKIKNEQIIEIVDHHKLNVNLPNPIDITTKTLGSTSSIIYKMFKEEGIEPSDKIKKLLLAGILSDTVGLKSTTTTDEDKKIAKKLDTKVDIDTQDLTYNIFKTKSAIKGLSPIEIAKKDFKTYNFGSKKVFINQIETVKPKEIIGKKEQLVKALNKARGGEDCDLGFITVTDILNERLQIIYSNGQEEKIIEEAFNTVGSKNIVDVGSRISRKRDIAPEIEAAINKLESAKIEV